MYAGILISVYYLLNFTSADPVISTYEIKIHNINNVEMCISNFGKIAQTQSQAAGCWWPKGSSHNYIFGAGIWFGTIIEGDTLVSVGYCPHGAVTEYVPGLCGQDQNDPAVKIYMYPNDWPPPHDIFPMTPQDTFSHQDSWCCYNDCDPSAHVPGDTRPIGLEVYQTGYAWDYPLLTDAIFMKFEIKNVTDDTLMRCYYGLVADADIGNEAVTGNDICGCIVGRWYVINGESLWVDDLGYQWQEEIEPGSPPWWPGVIGVDYLQSPWDLVANEDKDSDGIPDQYERDSVYFVTYLPPEQWDSDGDLTPDWRDPSQIPQWGMTSYKRFTLNLEPNKDNERYATMAGYNFKTGQYEPYDSIPPQPDDQRFFMGSGPFALPPDSVVTVMVAIMFADWMNVYARPDTALVLIDHPIQYIYDMNWLLPYPPAPPRLTCVPGDAKVTLCWTSFPETMADRFYRLASDSSSPFYDSLYREYDFEGYRVFRKRADISDTWNLLAQCDLYNNIQFAYEKNTGDIIYAENTGLFHSYTDSTARNGFPYHYAVTSFDFNQWDSWAGNRDIILESSKIEELASPRRDPANYVPGSFTIQSVWGNPELASHNVDAAIVYPLMTTTNTLTVEFSPIQYVGENTPCYAVRVRDADFLVDSLRAEMAINETFHHEFSMIHGLAVSVLLQREEIPSNRSIFDRISVSGTYPESLLVPSPMAANWAYRGNDFEVRWKAKSVGGPVNTVDVIDMMTDQPIPFKPGTTDSLADGWCFRSVTQVTDTIVYGTAGIGTRHLYICGGQFSIARGWLDTEPRPSASDVWHVSANTQYMPAPANAHIQLTPSPAQIPTDTTITLNVKVVPNPYIMYNDWDRGGFPHRIRFINLPHQCTIRIFTLGGEFVRAIVHCHLVPDEGSITDCGGDEWWDMLNLYGQRVCAGVYLFHVQSEIGEQVGKFVVMR